MNLCAQTPVLLHFADAEEMIDVSRSASNVWPPTEGTKWPIRYIVMASNKPNVFNLGGDLAIFVSAASREQ